MKRTAARRIAAVMLSGLTTAASIAVPAAAAIGVSALVTPAAHAYDRYPCGGRYYINTKAYGRLLVQQCLLTQNNVPVRFQFNPKSAVVGYLYSASGNWFTHQAVGVRQYRGNYWNKYWAYTQADNGRWGWVNQTYFAGGANDEPDGGLSYTFNSCPPRC